MWYNRGVIKKKRSAQASARNAQKSARVIWAGAITAALLAGGSVVAKIGGEYKDTVKSTGEDTAEEIHTDKQEKYVDLVDGSFTDIFSSMSWLNVQETTLYHEYETRTLGIPPTYNGEEKLIAVSSNINTFPAEVWKAKIIEADIERENADITLALSNDGVTWHEVRVGESVRFPETHHRGLYWRAEVQPGGAATTSLIGKIRLTYSLRFDEQ